MKVAKYLCRSFFPSIYKLIDQKERLLQGESYLYDQTKKYKDQIGIQDFITQIRILYPRSKNRADLSVSDLFSVILCDVLEKELKKKYSIKVKIDRNTYSVNESVKNDIRRGDCLIIIIITKDGLHKDSHPIFFEEIKECRNVLINGEKRKILFMPILLCLLENITEKESEIYNLVVRHDLERVEDFCALSLNFGLDMFRNQLLNSITRRMRSVNMAFP